VKVVGLMSGTSMDGMDAALLEIERRAPEDELATPPAAPAAPRSADPGPVDWTLLHFRSAPYDDARRDRIRAAIDAGDAGAICTLHAAMGAWSAEAVLALLDEAGVAAVEVAAIGSHGHTVWHRPPNEDGRGATLQLGDPATLAGRTGIPVVSDLRAADMAAGGHGAPLVPWPDRVLFQREDEAVALQNLGGIGNVTWLPPRGAALEPLAFDTGPGNGLLDLAVGLATEGRARYDVDGRRAARGEPDEALVARLLEMPFFDREPPRSTGRELFGPELVGRLVDERGLRPGRDEEGWDDLLATLVRLTARSIGEAYRRWVLPRRLDEVVLTGGGARNPHLVRRVREELGAVPVRTGADALGMDPDAREAAAFAVLAWAHLEGLPGTVPTATGASEARVLGSWTPAPGRSA